MNHFQDHAVLWQRAVPRNSPLRSAELCVQNCGSHFEDYSL